MRDFQRQKVYDAEDAVWKANRGSLPYAEFRNVPGSLKAVQRYITDLQTSPAVVQVFGAHELISAADGRGRRSAYADANGARVGLPVALRYELIILHEVSHCYVNDELPDHGGVFCETYLHFVAIAMGHRWFTVLRDEFLKRGVKLK